MKHQIRNEFLTVTINDMGAELVSIFDNARNREVLWQGDPSHWARHAPILFPNVGRHYNNQYLYNGKQYPSSQHGFARDMEFTCICASDTAITHRLISDASTWEAYPFDFILDVTHSLDGNSLKIQWNVENTGDHTMYFTIGGHPGFCVPILPDTKQTDYFLMFREDKLYYHLIDVATGTAVTDVDYPLILEDKRCPITRDMFDKDALIFDHQVQWAAIAYPDGTPYISMSCEGFSSLGIWSAPGAPFVCLEPWDGRCDNFGFEDEISNKPGICTLLPKQLYEKSYTIFVD